MKIHVGYTQCDKQFFKKFDTALCECFSEHFELETYSAESENIIRLPWDEIERVDIEKMSPLTVLIALGISTFEWTVKATVLFLLISWPLHIQWMSLGNFTGLWLGSTLLWSFWCGLNPVNFDRLYEVRIRCYGFHKLHFYVEKTGVELAAEIENCSSLRMKRNNKEQHFSLIGCRYPNGPYSAGQTG